MFRFRWWKEGFMNMLNRNFARRNDEGGLLSRLFRGTLGMRESTVSDSGRRQWFFFSAPRPMAVSAVVVSLIRLQTCVGSVCVGGTVLMCRGWECARIGSATRRVSFYVSLVGGGLRLSRPSSGRNGSVRVYRRVIFGKHNWRCA